MSDLRQRLAGLSPDKRALLERRLAQSSLAMAPGTSIPRRGADSIPHLSFAQQQMWLMDRLDPDSPLYNVAAAVRLDGPLDVAALERSVSTIVARHESLRTTFRLTDQEPIQVVAPPAPVPIRRIDLGELPPEDREAEARRLLAQEARRPFDLAADLMLRPTLLRLAEEEHLLLIVTHHIASDAWSQALLFQELSALYGAFSRGQACPLPEPSIQYADYALWQRDSLQRPALQELLAYWKERLAATPDLLELPADRPRPPIPSYRGARLAITLPPELARDLEALARREGATPFMAFLAAFQALLHRYTAREDIPVGCPVAGRTRPETEALIGFFVNTLVLQTDLSGDPSFRELLARVREAALGAYAHQELPFERLVEEIRPRRDPGHNPLFQVALAFENVPAMDLHLPGMAAQLLEVETGTSKFDLTLYIHPVEGATYRATLEYSTDLFDQDRMARMLGHLQTLLEGAAADPEARISALPVLTPAERNRILVDWNDTATDFPRNRCIHQLFEDQAEATPRATALLFGDNSLTYAQLNARANQMANHLRSLGVGGEALVGICVERSIEMIVGILGILKAGAAYLPLDPTYPKDRLAFMLQDARVPVLLTQQRLRDALPVAEARTVALDSDWNTIALHDQLPPPCLATPESLAYVMYTSGSTGKPKGVAVPHRAVVRLVRETNYARLTRDETILQFAPISFDASTFEIWGALLNGGRLALYAEDLPSLDGLGQAIARHGVTTLWLTAGLFQQVAEGSLSDFHSVRQLLTGGDVVSPIAARKALQALPGCVVINGYGPTEGTTFSCTYPMTDAASVDDPIPIGRPISNAQLYILDPALQPVPIGVEGELYIGGAGLARGYLDRPELTAEKFIPNPFGKPGERLYKTGDLVRYRRDGNVEFLGRRDDQVKIRGFRIELGEIETTLRQHPTVREAVALARQDPPGDKRLVAYLVPGSPQAPSAAELRAFLKARLPDYMIPSAFLALENLPITPNGKVDRRALPSPNWERGHGDRPYRAPGDEIEARLTALWGEILGIERVGVEDDFFELGGHSLLAVHLVARMEKEFGRQLPLATLIRYPTVAQFAASMEEATLPGEERGLAMPLQSEGSLPPFFCVHGFGGGVLDYAELAHLVGPGRPFYGLQAAGLDGREEPDTTVEEMAARYVAVIHAIQPKGPYRVGGYCFGGVVAFEIARQLEARGEAASLVAIIESYAPGLDSIRRPIPARERLAAIRHAFPFWIEDYTRMGMAGLRDRIQRRVASGWRSAQRHLGRAVEISVADVIPGSLSAVPEQYRRMMELHLRASRSYAPQEYSGRVTVFRAKGLTISRALLGPLDPELGWGPLAAGVEVRMVEGGHNNLHLKPYVPSLAEQLRQCLTEADKV